MFRRRDIPPVLLLVLLIILVMLTLSQILVVHNGRYGRNIHSIRRLQMELREMDVNLQSMMLQNVPSIELNRRLIQNEINARRVADIIRQASLPDSRFVRTRKRKSHNVTNTDIPVVYESVTFSSVVKSETESVFQWSNNDINATVDTPEFDREVDAYSSVQVSGDHSKTMTDISNGRLLNDSARTNSSYSRDVAASDPDELRSALKLDPSEAAGAWNASDFDQGLGMHHFANATATRTLALSNSTLARKRGRLKTWSTNSTKSVTYCPAVPPGLGGTIFINFEHKHDYTEAEVLRQNPLVELGGVGKPQNCTARHKVAIVIPYRDRRQHLTILLSHLHPMLQRQQLDYRIFVVEQYGDYTFNKARIMNIAFVEALKRFTFQCFVFHDVDLVPEDDRNMYSCPVQPRHMSVAIDEMGYKLAYQELVGGVLNMRTEHFQRVNGYSNLYWGWGAEDDDMAYRTKLLYTGTRRFQFDGLNSLQYRLVHVDERPLYTHILVDIGKPPRGF